MAHYFDYPFRPVGGGQPAFNSSAVGLSAAVYPLESTGVREWQFPSNRVVRVASIGAADFSIVFGTSTAAAIVSSTAGMLVLGGTVEGFHVDPRDNFVGIFAASTDVIVNFTIGNGGN